MEVFNVHDAKTHLSKLVRLNTEPRRPGRLKGRIHIAPDFDEPLPEEILAAFRGDSAG